MSSEFGIPDPAEMKREIDVIVSAKVPVTEDEWFDQHPWLDREQWMAADHSLCTHYMEDRNLPDWQACRSMHCPQCGKRTGGQGHLDRDGRCPNQEEK
jgi:hypothetical protein